MLVEGLVKREREKKKIRFTYRSRNGSTDSIVVSRDRQWKVSSSRIDKVKILVNKLGTVTVSVLSEN